MLNLVSMLSNTLKVSDPNKKCKKKLIHILQLAHFNSSIGEDVSFDMFMIFHSLPRDKNMVHN